MLKYFKFKDSTELRINNFWCVGRNYADHAKEMGANTEEEPIIFLKPSTSAVLDGKIHLPHFSRNVHFETELIVVIGEDAENIEEDEAENYIAGLGMGLDLTLRDIQSKLKEKSLPWALSKSFKGSAPISEIIPYKKFISTRYRYSMDLNGDRKQNGDTHDMIFSIPFLISYLSKKFILQKGDCIMTGTPAGVGQLKHKDKIKVQLEDKLTWELEVL